MEIKKVNDGLLYFDFHSSRVREVDQGFFEILNTDSTSVGCCSTGLCKYVSI